MFDKLFEAQKKAEEVKKRLDNISVSGECNNGAIKVVASGNKEIKNITLDAGFFSKAEREELEELLVVAINKALVQAENVSQAEMKAVTNDLLGGFNL